MRPQYVLGTVHQRFPQIPVPTFGDPQLRLLLSGFLSLRPHPQKASHQPASFKSSRIPDCQHVGKCGVHSYPVHLIQQPVLRIPCPRDVLLHLVVVSDSLVELIYHFQQWCHGAPDSLRNLFCALCREALYRALLQPLPKSFTDPPDRIDQLRAALHQCFPRTYPAQIRLHRLATSTVSLKTKA